MFERIIITVAVQKLVIVFDTIGGNEAVNGFSNCDPSLTQQAIISGALDCQGGIH